MQVQPFSKKAINSFNVPSATLKPVMEFFNYPIVFYTLKNYGKNICVIITQIFSSLFWIPFLIPHHPRVRRQRTLVKVDVFWYVLCIETTVVRQFRDSGGFYVPSYWFHPHMWYGTISKNLIVQLVHLDFRNKWEKEMKNEYPHAIPGRQPYVLLHKLITN